MLHQTQEGYLHADFASALVDCNSRSSSSTPSTAFGEVSRLESAILELAFNRETTHQLQAEIERGEFSANEVSLVSKELLVTAMNDAHANFVVSCLIKIFPEIMLYKVGTALFSLLTKLRKPFKGGGLRFLEAFLETGNLDIEDKILSQMWQNKTLQKFLLMYKPTFARVILKFVNSSKWADEIALFLLQKRKLPQYVLPAILACSDRHHPNLIQTDDWIAQNVLQEEIDFALRHLPLSTSLRLPIVSGERRNDF